MIALFDRVAVCDFVDVFALSRRFSKAEFFDRAADIDLEFSRSVFADMLDSLARYSDAALALGAVDIGRCGSSSCLGGRTALDESCAERSRDENGT